MPRLNLLPDDRLDLSFVFSPLLDERFDGSVEVVGHFTAVEGSISLPACTLWKVIGLPEGADIVDYTEEGRYHQIRSREHGPGSLTEDVQGVGGSWVAQDERAESWLQGHFVIGERRRW